MKSFFLATLAGVNATCTGDETLQESATVTCNADSMTVSLDGCAVDNLSNLDINAATLGNDNSDGCKVNFNADTNQYVFTSAIGECNTQVSKDDTTNKLTYSNFVKAQQGLSVGPITRVRSMNIDFGCEFDLAHTLSLDNGFSPTLSNFEVTMDTQSGSFAVAMAVYTDATFQTAVEGALEVQVPEPIHIQVHSDDMTVQLKECWATPTNDPDDTTNYPFIVNYCGDEHELNTYETLVIHQNGVSGSGQFSIDSFKFTNSDDAVEMFIHCDITLCDPSDSDCNVCQDTGSRKRRSAGHKFVGTVAVNVN